MKEVASSVHNSSAQELFLKMVSVIWQATEQLFVTQTIKKTCTRGSRFHKVNNCYGSIMDLLKWDWHLVFISLFLFFFTVSAWWWRIQGLPGACDASASIPALIRAHSFRRCWFCPISASVNTGKMAINGLKVLWKVLTSWSPWKGLGGTQRFDGHI